MAKKKKFAYGPGEEAPSEREFVTAWYADGVKTAQDVLDKLKEMKRPLSLAALLGREKSYRKAGVKLKKLAKGQKGRKVDADGLNALIAELTAQPKKAKQSK